MVRHIVCWNYKTDFTMEQKQEYAAKIKRELEQLSTRIDGIVSIEVITDTLKTSTPDIVLNSVFVDEEALKKYQVHEEHIKVGTFIGSVTQNRYCVDYYEE